MILISGTDLEKTDLPLSDLLDYHVISPSGGELKIKLKTIGFKAQAIYINKNISVEIPKGIEEKVQWFSKDSELLSFLNASDDNNEVKKETGTVDEETDADVSAEDKVDMSGYTELSATSTRNVQEIKSIEELPNISLTEEEMYVPITKNEETSYMQKRIETKDSIIQQKNAQLQEMNNRVNEAIRIRDEDAERIRNEHNDTVRQANLQIEQLTDQIKSLRLPSDEKRFLGMYRYVKKPQGQLVEGFMESDTDRYLEATKNGSKLFIFAAGPNESFKGMITEVDTLVKEAEKDAIFVDFTGDPYIHNRNNLSGSKTILDLIAGEDIERVVTKLYNVSWIKTAPYNDILLIGIDWIDLLCKLIKYADGRPVILLFNAFTSFSVNYTISKLGLLGSLRVFITASTVSITSAVYPLAFLPPDRVQLVVISYIEELKTLMTTSFKKNQSLAFMSSVGWNMLGLDIVPVQPFEVEPLKQMNTNKV